MPSQRCAKKPPAPDELPPQVDSRQLSPFAAAWTLAMIKQLAENGAASVTLFETTGWRGVMERGSSIRTGPISSRRPGQVVSAFSRSSAR